ncbi:MAG: hypothetical protein DRJ97_05770 [Thermoprotei archaeon]|nr:MAG: hypothetical protein DRJ69_04460 [Thermoprotei archaeon]RLF14703.1 MAG: hypothetical protein DRJ97_05770 [Thermoprotei archaeon]
MRPYRVGLPRRYLNLALCAIQRYLKLDLKYPFELATNLAIFVAPIVALSLVGYVFTASSHAPLEGMSFTQWVLSGFLFWSIIGWGYDDAVATVQDEISKGTVTFLISSGLSPSLLVLARSVASTFKAALISLLILVPAASCLGFAFNLSHGSSLILAAALLSSWLFMLALSMMFSSIAYLTKKLGTAPYMLKYALQVLSGFFFPVGALGAVFSSAFNLEHILQFFTLKRSLDLFRLVTVKGAVPSLGLMDLVPLALTPALLLLLAFLASMLVQRLALELGLFERY